MMRPGAPCRTLRRDGSSGLDTSRHRSYSLTGHSLLNEHSQQVVRRRRQVREYGAGIWLFGQFVDRYASDAYGPPVTTVEAIERAATVPGPEVAGHQLPLQLAGRDGRRTSPPPWIGRACGPSRSRRTSTCASSAMGTLHQPRPCRPPAGHRSVQDRASRSRIAWMRRYLKFWPGQDGHDYPVPGRPRAHSGTSSSTACARSSSPPPSCSSRSSTSSRSRAST